MLINLIFMMYMIILKYNFKNILDHFYLINFNLYEIFINNIIINQLKKLNYIN